MDLSDGLNGLDLVFLGNLELNLGDFSLVFTDNIDPSVDLLLVTGADLLFDDDLASLLADSNSVLELDDLDLSSSDLDNDLSFFFFLSSFLEVGLPFGDLCLGAAAWSLDLVDSDGDDLASLVASDDSACQDINLVVKLDLLNLLDVKLLLFSGFVASALLVVDDNDLLAGELANLDYFLYLISLSLNLVDSFDSNDSLLVLVLIDDSLPLLDSVLSASAWLVFDDDDLAGY